MDRRFLFSLLAAVLLVSLFPASSASHPEWVEAAGDVFRFSKTTCCADGEPFGSDWSIEVGPLVQRAGADARVFYQDGHSDRGYPGRYVVDQTTREILEMSEEGPPRVGQYFSLWLPADVSVGDTVVIHDWPHEVMAPVDLGDEGTGLVLEFEGISDGILYTSRYVYSADTRMLFSSQWRSEHTKELWAYTSERISHRSGGTDEGTFALVGKAWMPLTVVGAVGFVGVGYAAYRQKRKNPPGKARVACVACGEQKTGAEEFCTSCGVPFSINRPPPRDN